MPRRCAVSTPLPLLCQRRRRRSQAGRRPAARLSQGTAGRTRKRPAQREHRLRQGLPRPARRGRHPGCLLGPRPQRAAGGKIWADDRRPAARDRRPRPDRRPRFARRAHAQHPAAQAVDRSDGAECQRAAFQRHALRAAAPRRHPARRLPAPADRDPGPGAPRCRRLRLCDRPVGLSHDGPGHRRPAHHRRAAGCLPPPARTSTPSCCAARNSMCWPTSPATSAAAQGGTRLAHDTLAPLVRRDYDHSAHPAQQAARLLESRAVDWSEGRTGALLDDSALALVDKGIPGMRSLTADEQRLLAASRQAQAQRTRQRRFWRTAAAVAAGTILGLLAIALLLWNNQQVVTAEKESAVAKAQLEAERADPHRRRTPGLGRAQPQRRAQQPAHPPARAGRRPPGPGQRVAAPRRALAAAADRRSRRQPPPGAGRPARSSGPAARPRRRICAAPGRASTAASASTCP